MFWIYLYLFFAGVHALIFSQIFLSQSQDERKGMPFALRVFSAFTCLVIGLVAGALFWIFCLRALVSPFRKEWRA